jgi:hypothetical protein
LLKLKHLFRTVYTKRQYNEHKNAILDTILELKAHNKNSRASQLNKSHKIKAFKKKTQNDKNDTKQP